VIASWKIAPALACGNTAVVKPASQTPLTTLALADVLTEAGLPEGALSVVPGPGSTAAAALIADPRIAKISFTGSTEVGTRVMQAGAEHIARVSLELGGKSANVVFSDADLDVCVEKSIWSVFDNAGQDCCARSRTFVQRQVYDEFVERFAKRAESIVVGDPLDDATEMGPLISQTQRRTSLDYIGIGLEDGARKVAGGDVPESNGFFLRPTVLADVDNGSRVAREEIFGPVACLLPFDSEEQAIAMANDSPYGLSGSVWTQNLGRAIRVAKAIRAGVLSVNSSSSVHTEAPFGGYKQSGMGREMGMHAVNLYTEVKNVYFSQV
jgi:acyl-CoA reductase-like NAD-dependent aldehyde dehydrogenase